MAWHHIIPFSLLREVWNRLVDQHIATELAEARVAIRQYLLLSDRNQPHVDALIERMRAENTGQKRASHYNLRPLDVSEAHQLATAAVWPAWNAIEGPQRRSDDPQDRYFDRFTSGLTADEAARMRAIEALFGPLRALVNAGPAPGPRSLRAFAQAASGARSTLCCDLPLRFRPEMWVDDGAGLWRKRRDGESYTVTGH
jgi:hypothetical protein